MKKLILILLGCFSIGFAQSGVGISPPRVELQASPGAQLTQEIAVDNPSKASELEVTIVPSDVLMQPDGSVIYLEPGGHPNSLANWLSLSALQFNLAPEASDAVTYSAQVPLGTPDGTYWTVLFFESDTPANLAESQGIGVRSRVRIGHVVYIDVGQVTREGQIEGIRLNEIQEDQSEVRVMFKNTGTGLVRVEGSVEIRSEKGKLLRTLEIPSTAAFPGYSREVVASLEEPLEPGNYVVLAVLDYGAATVTAGEGRIEVQ